MKRFWNMLFLVIAFTLFISGCGSQVEIPDENLRIAIEDALGKIAGEPITQAEMTTLTALNESLSVISDLTGLQFATQLKDLRLDDNNISDITPLAGLTRLTVLDLNRNNISDITPLAGLIRLTVLDLNRNNISDITPLAGLIRLKYLKLDDNNISDISPLAGLTQLESLWLRGSNPLNAMAFETHIPDHRRRGSTVYTGSFQGIK